MCGFDEKDYGWGLRKLKGRNMQWDEYMASFLHVKKII